MNKISLFFLLIVFMTSCQSKKEDRPTDSLGTGRAFINASLKGDFNEAETLLLHDTQNIQLFEAYKLYYNRMPEEKKKQYKSAAYEINKYEELNDSVTIINFSNDYMKKPMELKIVRMNGNWNVDFKYTYSGNLPID
jgi:hypothetical protein